MKHTEVTQAVERLILCALTDGPVLCVDLTTHKS